MKFLSAAFEENPVITDDLAILLLFQTGMRIGELVALKWSDIEGNYIHVQRMERKESVINEDLSFGTHNRFVVNHVKTKTNTATG